MLSLVTLSFSFLLEMVNAKLSLSAMFRFNLIEAYHSNLMCIITKAPTTVGKLFCFCHSSLYENLHLILIVALYENIFIVYDKG